MAILLDSASVDDATTAATLGFVSGITTNPALMARETSEPLPHLDRLLAAFPGGALCYQPTSSSVSEMTDEARGAWSRAPERIVIKLPATLDAVRVATILRRRGHPLRPHRRVLSGAGAARSRGRLRLGDPLRRQGGPPVGRRPGRGRRPGGDPRASAERHPHPGRQPEERPAGGRGHPPRRPRRHRAARRAGRPPGAPAHRVGRARVRGRSGGVTKGRRHERQEPQRSRAASTRWACEASTCS